LPGESAQTATDNNTTEGKEVFISHQARLDCLAVIKPLHKLTKLVQKHRGASTAVLAGNTRFNLQVDDLQLKVQRLFIALDHVIQNRQNPPLACEQLKKLHNDWLTIKYGWPEDQVIENFEFHSHLLNQLQKHSWQTVRSLFIDIELPNSPGLTQPISSHSDFIDFSLREIPEMVELLAKLRGLSTHCSVTGTCDPHHQVRLQYLTRQIRLRQSELSKRAKIFGRAIHLMAPNIPYLIAYEIKLNNLLQLIEQFILVDAGSLVSGQEAAHDAKNEANQVTSEELFELASTIIGIYAGVSDQAINALEHGVKQEVDAWLDC
jgi:hypothetical protein